jgi:hypothetical protein
LFGGVLISGNGGWNPAGSFPAKGFEGRVGVLVLEPAPRIPAALNLSSKELASGIGVEDGTVAGGGL